MNGSEVVKEGCVVSPLGDRCGIAENTAKLKIQTNVWAIFPANKCGRCSFFGLPKRAAAVCHAADSQDSVVKVSLFKTFSQ